MKVKTRIVPLSEKNLEDAIALAHMVFKTDVESGNPPEMGFRASLDTQWKKKLLAKNQNIKDLTYFLLVDEYEKVIGTTGFYTHINEPDVVWLGWFCVNSEYRGQKLGEYLLKWSIEKAKEQGYSILRLYTSTEPNEAIAQKLYEKMGFQIVGIEKEEKDEYTTLYKELKLK